MIEPLDLTTTEEFKRLQQWSAAFQAVADLPFDDLNLLCRHEINLLLQAVHQGNVRPRIVHFADMYDLTNPSIDDTIPDYPPLWYPPLWASRAEQGLPLDLPTHDIDWYDPCHWPAPLRTNTTPVTLDLHWHSFFERLPV